MRALNEAIEGAADFRDFMGRIAHADAQRLDEASKHADRGESVQGNPLPLGMQRQSGENRAAHRARLKQERREAKRVAAKTETTHE